MTFKATREPKRHTWHQPIDPRGQYICEPIQLSMGELHKGDLFCLFDEKGQSSGWQVATTDPWQDDNGIWTIAALAAQGV